MAKSHPTPSRVQAQFDFDKATPGTEEWREIPGFPGYEISDAGRVRSWWAFGRVFLGGGCRRGLGDRPLVLKPARRKDSPYLNVGIRDADGKLWTKPIHVLVLLSFVGPRPDKNAVACHFPDPDPTNNRRSNLKWGSRSENMLHAIGEGRSTAKLKAEQVPPIWEAIQAGETVKAIAERFGVTRAIVAQIKCGGTWRHVTESLPGHKPWLSKDDREPVRAPDTILATEEEIWRDVPGWTAYRVSSWGRVLSRWVKRSYLGDWSEANLIKLHCFASGHLMVRLYEPGSLNSWRSVHRLVLETFAGQAPEGMEACHEDGNPANNHIRNLRWDTKSANRIDISRHGHSRGLKLNMESVREIRIALEDGTPTREIARRFGVSQELVRNVRRGKNWSHVDSESPEEN